MRKILAIAAVIRAARSVLAHYDAIEDCYIDPMEDLRKRLEEYDLATGGSDSTDT